MAHQQTPHAVVPSRLLALSHQQSRTRKHDYKNMTIRKWTLASCGKLCKRTCTLDGLVISFNIIRQKKTRRLFGIKSELKLALESRKKHKKRAQGMRTVLERPKSQVLPHGEARAGVPRAPHGATAARKVHPETLKISETMRIL